MANRKTIDVNVDMEAKEAPKTVSEAEQQLIDLFAADKKRNPYVYEVQRKDEELARRIANLK